MSAGPGAHTRETDLYAPLRDYLEARGYSVRSEVKGCDVVAERGGETIVLELKRNLSVSLLTQAVERQRSFESVYVVVPDPGKRARSRQWRSTCRLLKRLELGLVLVDLTPGHPCPGRTAVEVAFHPVPFQRRTDKVARRAVLIEFHGRSADLNRGGSTGRKIVTAYRESAIQLGCLLEALGPSSPSKLRRMGASPNAGVMLRDNFYRWFERVERGVYSLTGHGAEEIRRYPELYERYSALAREAGGHPDQASGVPEQAAANPERAAGRPGQADARPKLLI